MRIFTIAVLLAAGASAQDDGGPSAKCRALFGKLSSLDPAVRTEAEQALSVLVTQHGVALQKAAEEDDAVARIVLSLHGIPDHRKDVEALVKREDPVIVRAAAEALGRVAPDASVKELLAVLSGEDLRASLAAARSLARAKIPAVRALLEQIAGDVVNLTAKMAAIYALELKRPSVDGVKAVIAQSENGDKTVRLASWAVLANLEHAPDEAKKVKAEKSYVLLPGLRTIFLEEKLPEEQRDLLGKILLDANGLFYGEIVGYAVHENEDVAMWARKVLLDPKRLKKGVLVEGLIRVLATYKEMTDENKDDVIALEMLLQSQGAEGAGEKLEDRVKAYREWWNRNRISTIDRDVAVAIDEGVEWLRRGQNKDGSWSYCTCGLRAANTTHDKGATALTVYTLIKCDVRVDDPQVKKGVDYLLSIPVSQKQHTYTVSLEAMAFAEMFEKVRKMAKAEKDKRKKVEYLRALQAYSKRLQDAAGWLVQSMRLRRRGGYPCGDWSYGTANSNADNSNTQFAVLGLRSAQNAGVPIPAKIWAASHNHWYQDQLTSGGWPYRGDPKKKTGWGSRSMSAAGYYCYLVTKASLRRQVPEKYLSDAPMEKATDWMEKRYPVQAAAPVRQGGHVHSMYYDLYSVERAMMISKQDRIGSKNWYHDGAITILTNQFTRGEWIDTTDTCFALLFLKRAFVAVATGSSR